MKLITDLESVEEEDSQKCKSALIKIDKTFF